MTERDELRQAALLLPTTGSACITVYPGRQAMEPTTIPHNQPHLRNLDMEIVNNPDGRPDSWI